MGVHVRPAEPGCPKSGTPAEQGLYARANAGALPDMTGVGQVYQEPRQPDLVVAGIGPVREIVHRLVPLVLSADRG
jgi:adenylylsulfate kinase-like enzyme